MPGLPETFHFLDESEAKADACLSAIEHVEEWLTKSADSASQEMNRLLLCRGENFTSVTLDQAIGAVSEAEVDLSRLQNVLEEVKFKIQASKQFIGVYRALISR
jgi:hypothetical protein